MIINPTTVILKRKLNRLELAESEMKQTIMNFLIDLDDEKKMFLQPILISSRCNAFVHHQPLESRSSKYSSFSVPMPKSTSQPKCLDY